MFYFVWGRCAGMGGWVVIFYRPSPAPSPIDFLFFRYVNKHDVLIIYMVSKLANGFQNKSYDQLKFEMLESNLVGGYLDHTYVNSTKVHMFE